MKPQVVLLVASMVVLHGCGDPPEKTSTVEQAPSAPSAPSGEESLSAVVPRIGVAPTASPGTVGSAAMGKLSDVMEKRREAEKGLACATAQATGDAEGVAASCTP